MQRNDRSSILSTFLESVKYGSRRSGEGGSIFMAGPRACLPKDYRIYVISHVVDRFIAYQH